MPIIKLSDFFFRTIGIAYLTLVYYVWFKGVCRGRIEGEHIVRSCINQGFVLAANHVSALDPPILMAYFYFNHRTLVAFLSGQRNYTGSFTAGVHRVANSVKVAESAYAIGREAIARMRKAQVVGIFPEGRRSSDGLLCKAKPGVVLIAQKLGRPVVPVALKGFYEMWPKTRRFPRPRRCIIAFGEPITCVGAEFEKNRKHQAEVQTERVMASIADMLGHPAPTWTVAR